MAIKWIYGEPDHPQLTGMMLPNQRNAATHRINGIQWSGKSALGENIMYNHVRNGSTAYDFYAANDNESLVALNSPYRDMVWLVHGDEVRLECNYNTIRISDLYPQHSPSNRIYITNKKFYKTDGDKFAALLKFTTRAQERDTFTRIDVVFIREAQKYISSQTKSNQARNKKEALENFVDFHEEMVHSGFCVILDAQRQMEVSKSVRELTKFWYLKNLGRMEIPPEIHWIYSDNTVDFDLDSLRHLNPDQFLILTDHNSIGLGTFEMPEWHIHRGSGLLASLGIQPVDKDSGRAINIEEEKEREDAEGNAPKHAWAQHAGQGRSALFSPVTGTRVDGRKATGNSHDVMIDQMDAQKIPRREIFKALISEGYTGSISTVDNRLRVLRILRMAKQQSTGEDSTQP